MDKDSIERIRTATFPLARRGYDRREVDRFLARLAEWLEADAPETPAAAPEPPEPPEAVRQALADVGERTAAILLAAEAAASTMRSEAETDVKSQRDDVDSSTRKQRADADEYATDKRTGAETEAERTRVDADSYSAEVREGSDTYAQTTRRKADQYASEVKAEIDSMAETARAETESKEAASRDRIESDEAEQLEQARLRAKALIDDATARRDEIEAEIVQLGERRDSVLEGIQRLTSELTGTASSHAPAASLAATAAAVEAEVEAEQAADAGSLISGDSDADPEDELIEDEATEAEAELAGDVEYAGDPNATQTFRHEFDNGEPPTEEHRPGEVEIDADANADADSAPDAAPDAGDGSESDAAEAETTIHRIPDR